MSRPVDSLIDFLKAEQARGKSHVYLDQDARSALRELFIRSRKPAPTAHTPASVAELEPEPEPAPIAIEVVISGNNKTEQLTSIRNQTANWPPATNLGSLRDKMVFSAGNPDADIMYIGEAPGYQEERKGEPFAGPSGEKLDGILKAMGLTREQVYLTTLVKFRPSMPRQTTNNRRPTPEEMEAFLPLLLAEISIVQPKVIIILGSTAAESLLEVEQEVSALTGKWHQVADIPTRVTYHPSYLLQGGSSNDIKRALWEDMLAAMEKLDMPISEKQRNFFLPKK